MKLKGGNLPAVFTADTSIAEMDDAYLIYRAAGLALAGSPSEQARGMAGGYFRLANQRALTFPSFPQARYVQ